MYLSGGLGKDPYTTQFDNERQALGVRLQAAYDAHQQTGLAAAAAAIESILVEHTNLYNRLRPFIEASWIDPRYWDIQNFWQKIANDWKAQAPAAAPSTAYVYQSNGAAPGEYAVPLLGPGSAAAAASSTTPASGGGGFMPAGPMVDPAAGFDLPAIASPAAPSSAGGWLPWIAAAIGAGLLMRGRRRS
jgi:hypothetical protein